MVNRILKVLGLPKLFENYFELNFIRPEANVYYLILNLCYYRVNLIFIRTTIVSNESHKFTPCYLIP